ncbi:MAG TPA: heme-binding domain-containing protein [Chitinophagaceae bacterium]|nr:heme-binding domain-containing protein [Chitinophagaceae bacterium]HUM64283.1 heme-binding domain-containing protein [Chitinophagaceae bacterium]
MLKKILIFLLVVLVVIQFIHPARNKAEGPQPNYIGNAFAVPGDVKLILEKACNDCHSNNTRYPWYSYIQPVDWWLAGHVNDGKAELNFDEYTNRSLRYQYHKMEEVEELVVDGSMPLDSYTWTHGDAKLTAEEKDKLINWSKSVRKDMETKYPIDSLVRKN